MCQFWGWGWYLILCRRCILYYVCGVSYIVSDVCLILCLMYVLFFIYGVTYMLFGVSYIISDVCL